MMSWAILLWTAFLLDVFDGWPAKQAYAQAVLSSDCSCEEPMARVMQGFVELQVDMVTVMMLKRKSTSPKE